MGSPYRDAERGDDYAPYDLNSGQDLAVWGITMGAHDNKIEVYDTEDGDGEALRDLILKLLQTSSSVSDPKWSPTPPTQDGWYWLKEHEFGISVVLVLEKEVWFVNQDWSESFDKLKPCLWYGPIEAPPL
jgi:hypothetical protein